MQPFAMTEENTIDRRFLRKLLRELETNAHDVYALMYGLPREHIFLYRFGDPAGEAEECDDPASNTFSIREFYDRYENFHPGDAFGICFAVHSDRIDSSRAAEYTGRLCLETRGEATLGGIRESLTIFLEAYCDFCLRKNTPFELTPEVVARFGLTSDDTEILHRLLEHYNTAAKHAIRAEYEALRRLDFLRNE